MGGFVIDNYVPGQHSAGSYTPAQVLTNLVNTTAGNCFTHPSLSYRHEDKDQSSRTIYSELTLNHINPKKITIPKKTKKGTKSIPKSKILRYWTNNTKLHKDISDLFSREEMNKHNEYDLSSILGRLRYFSRGKQWGGSAIDVIYNDLIGKDDSKRNDDLKGFSYEMPDGITLELNNSTNIKKIGNQIIEDLKQNKDQARKKYAFSALTTLYNSIINSLLKYNENVKKINVDYLQDRYNIAPRYGKHKRLKTSLKDLQIKLNSSKPKYVIEALKNLEWEIDYMLDKIARRGKQQARIAGFVGSAIGALIGSGGGGPISDIVSKVVSGGIDGGNLIQ